MTFHPVRQMRWLLFGWALCGTAVAGDWTLSRYEGRDYVPLGEIAKFYGFPPPPPVAHDLVVAPETPAPVAPTTAPNAPAAAESEVGGTSVEPVGGKLVKLENGNRGLSVTLNSREAEINGVKQWLAFPTRVQDGQVLVSRLDLSKVIEPRLRPDKIQGLKPVTTVVLDPGHGGHDKGAPSRYGYEKDFALDVALAARKALEKQGIKVVMTRSADIFVPLHERAAVANGIKDSIFVSIHFNSATANPNARGFEIYSLAPRGAPATNDGNFSVRNLREEPGNVVDTQSTALAGTVFHALLGNVPLPDRGVKHARFAVLRLCTQPAILVECGFVSNASESALIGSAPWRKQVADAIVMGVGGFKELAEQGHQPRLMVEYRGGAAGH